MSRSVAKKTNFHESCYVVTIIVIMQSLKKKTARLDVTILDKKINTPEYTRIIVPS